MVGGAGCAGAAAGCDSAARDRFLRRRQKKMMTVMIASPATPPTTPPAMAPVFVPDLRGTDVPEEVAGGIVLVALRVLVIALRPI